MQIVNHYIILILILLCIKNCPAQIFTDSSEFVSTTYLLKVANEKKGIIRYFSENEEVIYRKSDAPVLKIEGNVDHIDKDTVIISGDHIAISDLVYLASKAQKKDIHFVNFMLTLAGAITTTSGIILLTVAQPVPTLVGGVSIIIGAPIFIGGITNYFTTNYLIPEKGWTIETMQLGGYPTINRY